LLGHIQKSTDVLSGVLFDQNLGYFVWAQVIFNCAPQST
jgi:hypothetical protein